MSEVQSRRRVSLPLPGGSRHTARFSHALSHAVCARRAVEAQGAGESPLGAKIASKEAAKIVDESSLSTTGVPSEFLMLPTAERMEMEAKLRVALKDVAGAHRIYETLYATPRK